MDMIKGSFDASMLRSGHLGRLLLFIHGEGPDIFWTDFEMMRLCRARCRSVEVDRNTVNRLNERGVVWCGDRLHTCDD